MRDGKHTECKLLGEAQCPTKNYLSYKEAKELVERSQPFDPADPSQRLHPFPHFVRDAVDYLIFGEEEEWGQVKFYTAVGSAFDFFHGVDCFLIVTQGDKETIITMDLTCNPEKLDCKADVLIHIPEKGVNQKHNRGNFLEFVNKTTVKIVQAFENCTTKTYLDPQAVIDRLVQLAESTATADPELADELWVQAEKMMDKYI